MIYHNEEYVNIAELDEHNDIRFTKTFLELTAQLGGNRRRLASQLISHWTGDHLHTLLDYFGPDDQEDLYSGLDTDPLDIQENTMDMWDYQDLAGEGLEAEWYRDVLRAKLVSIKLPKRLIEQYVKTTLNKMEN
jgi:hypothetical protein